MRCVRGELFCIFGVVGGRTHSFKPYAQVRSGFWPDNHVGENGVAAVSN